MKLQLLMLTMGASLVAITSGCHKKVAAAPPPPPPPVVASNPPAPAPAPRERAARVAEEREPAPRMSASLSTPHDPTSSTSCHRVTHHARRAPTERVVRDDGEHHDQSEQADAAQSRGVAACP